MSKNEARYRYRPPHFPLPLRPATLWWHSSFLESMHLDHSRKLRVTDGYQILWSWCFRSQLCSARIGAWSKPSRGGTCPRTIRNFENTESFIWSDMCISWFLLWHILYKFYGDTVCIPEKSLSTPETLYEYFHVELSVCVLRGKPEQWRGCSRLICTYFFKKNF